MNQDQTLWVLLPAYNEEESLPNLLPKIVDILEEQAFPYRIVAVNDGSSDQTGAMLVAYQKEMPLDILTHPINRGLGETERDGFEFIASHCAPDDLIVRFDCDDTHEPKYILDLIAKIESGYDVVNTSRFQPGGAQYGVNGYRAFISRGANIFMKMLFNIPQVKDYSCGFRAYRGRVIQDAIKIFGNNFIQLRGLGFTSTLEMIVKLHLLGARTAEVPFVLRYDQKVSNSKMVSSITTAGYLVMAVLYHWPFGGWKRQFSGLRNVYRSDPDAAVEKFSCTKLPRRTVSQISL